MGPQSCHRCQAIITHTGLAARVPLLHPQVLSAGRAESGAFRSTPALNMIRAEACSVVRIFSTETSDTHILIIDLN